MDIRSPNKSSRVEGSAVHTHSTFRKFKFLLRSHDDYGYNIRLNTKNDNQTGYSQKTPIGGIISIFLRILFLIYVLFQLQQMLLFNDDRTYINYTSNPN